MPTPIEITTIRDQLAVAELIDQSYSNTEPGFQIDEVRNVEDLVLVLDAIAKRIPDKSETVVFDCTQVFKATRAVGPHTDGSWKGLAVHQELSDEIDLVIATSTVGYLGPPSVIVPSNSKNVRHGKTKPGRITIFAEGGYDWLDSTIHFFDRGAEFRSRLNWARYAQFRPLESEYITSLAFADGAKIAFRALNKVLCKAPAQK